MEKTIISISLALFLSVSAFAQDTWEFGLKGGIALNMMPGTTVNMYDKFRPNLGFQAGGYVAFHISDMVITQLEALYSRKGVSTKNDAPGVLFGGASLLYTRNIHYLQFPLMIGISTANDRAKILIGPELGIYLGNNVNSKLSNGAPYTEPLFESAYYKLNPFNLALGLQATYFITDSFGIEVKGDLGLTRTFVDETEDKGRNTALQLGVCWRFGY